MKFKLAQSFLDKLSDEDDEIVEINPSSCSKKEFQEFMAFFVNSQCADLSAINTKVINLENEMGVQAKKITDLETAANNSGTKLELLNQKLNEIEQKNKSLVQENIRILSKMETNEERVLDLERYTRSFNLRFNNIPETHKEGEKENCVKLLEGILKEVGLSNVEVENAHRVGDKNDTKNKSESKIRTIIARFSKRPERRIVISKRKEFFQMGIPMYEDMQKADLDAKQKYANEMKELYQKNNKVYFQRGAWYVNGKRYIGK